MTGTTGGRRRAVAVTALDVAVSALAVLAVVSWVFGGIGSASTRMSALTWWPFPAAAALAISSIRRRFLAQPALWPRLVTWGRGHEALAAARPPFLFTRLPILIIGYVTVVLVGFPVTADWLASSDPLWNLLARWDTGWYVEIATKGYVWTGRTDIEQNIVFFPAFPILMRAVAELLRSHAMVGGLAVSLTAFLGAMVYLYRLARLNMDGEAAAGALALTACYPYAVFYSAAYTESLFLVAVVGAFYHFRQAQWFRAGLWGLVVGLTRPNGFVLSVPLACIALAPLMTWIGPRLRWWLTGSEDRPEGGIGRTTRGLAAASMPGVGLLLFLAFNYWFTGDPTTWMRAVEAWGRTVPGAGPFAGALGVGVYNTKDVFNASASIFAAGMIPVVAWRFGAPYALFTLLLLAPPFLSGGLESMGRYSSVAFPMFLGLAAVLNRSSRLALTIAFALLQVLAATMFFTWRPMY